MKTMQSDIIVVIGGNIETTKNSKPAVGLLRQAVVRQDWSDERHFWSAFTSTALALVVAIENQSENDAS